MMDTPSKFLRPDVDVSFHLDEVFALLKTPAHEQKMMKATLTPDTVRYCAGETVFFVC